MISKNSRLSTRRAASLATLLGSASVLTMAGVTGASAAEPVATVTITGSLIAGAAAVGVPVTALGQEDFTEVGALNVLELLESVPGLIIPPTNSPAFGAGTLHFANNVQIHGLGVGDTLLMVDGVRWPLMGYDGQRVDPAIIPQLAVERVDVLTSGASATYGADATAGVINIILKRGYDGAETFIRGGFAPGSGNESITLAQLYGTSWDTGNVTLTYEFQRVNKVEGSDLPWYTWNFGEAGFEGFDFTQLSASPQGFVTIRGPLGNSNGRMTRAPGVLTPVGRGIHGCANCYSVPHGIGWDFGTQDPGPTTSWAALQARAGVREENLRNPWHDGWARPEMESTAAVMTFSQRLTPMLEVFGFNMGSVTLNVDGNWSNRRFKQSYPGDQGQTREHMSRIERGIEIPSNNPYFPSGVPAGNRVFAHFSLLPESEDIVSGGMQNARWLTRLDFDELPFNWRGNISYSQTENFSYGYDRGGVNVANYTAALGHEVEIDASALGLDGDIVLTKPAGIPYLNPFCDSLVIQHCNSQTTLDWITGFRDQSLFSHYTELSAQIDGPLFDLPGGPILAAIAVNRSNRGQEVKQVDNTNSEYLDQIVVGIDNTYEVNDAVIGQANIPVLGGDFSAPGFESLDLELGLRYDKYDTLEKAVWTPKYALNWQVGYGLTFRASYGTSFRTPKGEQIFTSGAGVQARNISGSIESVNSTLVDCGLLDSGGVPSGGTVGTAAGLAAIINPTCNTTDPRLFAPTIVDLTGPPALAAPILAASGLAGGISTDLGPQDTKQWNLGFNFSPNNDFLGGALVGLSADATYWQLDYFNLIGSTFRGRGPNDPLSAPFYITITNPNAPITDPSNAAYLALVRALANIPTRVSRAPDDFGIETTRAIALNFNGNLGRAIQSGIDFNVRYDWEMGNLGSFHVGASGYYEILNKTKGSEDDAWEDLYRFESGGEVASGGRLQKVRYRAGWTDGTWTVNSFFNYYAHGAAGSDGGGYDSNASILTPPCFYTAGQSCYPGAPNYSASVDPETGLYPFLSPANVLVDLQIGYNTGMSFSNNYLHNVGISLSITNILDKAPPMGVYPLRSRGTGVAAFDRNYPDLGREISLTINKTW